ncbi:MAG: translation initiation factor IF-1 [Lentisphaerae bacterium]|nr:MAG: translation initiation factor IF-1 [Lentisphaerota bacterium]
MAKENDMINAEGVVTELLSNGLYRVELDNGHQLLCQAKGRMRRFNIRILQGDRVKVEISPYDLTKGRIIYRNK